jgi:hypothetical protein
VILVRGNEEEIQGRERDIGGGRFSLWRSGERGDRGRGISASNDSGVEGGSDQWVPHVRG